jgi:hypothetical protein
MNEYAAGWARYRRLRMQLILSFALFVPCTAGLAYIFINLFNTSTPAFVIAVLWMAWFGVSVVLFSLFRCPRCNKFFATGRFVHLSVFADRCLHCGLKKFEMN